MSSVAADFLSNLLANQAFRIWRKESGEATNEHVKPSVGERTSVMGDTAREGEGTMRAGEEGTLQRQTGATSLEGQGGELDALEVDGNKSRGEASGRPGATSQPSVEYEEPEDRVRQRSGLERAVDQTELITALPIRPRYEAPATEDDMSDNPEYGIPDRFQDSPTSSVDLSDSPTGSSTQGDSSFPTRGALPEDDGMRELRKKILVIQVKDIPTEEKARLMHELLTEGYTKSQVNQQTTSPTVPPSPATIVSQERPTTPTSISSFSFWSTKDTSPGKGDTVRFHLSPNDLQPTYAPLPLRAEGVSDNSDDAELVQVFGCEHYKRNVKLQCSTCSKWYTCRLCHDAAEDHILSRRETKNMLCMICGTAQRAAEICTHCGGRAANYYCDICHLWEDDANRSIYHCNDCGICRVGMGLGKDFFHCKTCGLCMNISMEQSHKCIERSSDCDCPICHEYMFTSPQTVVFMRCGHTIHRHCYHAHLETSYKCPICQQTIVNMETQFRNLDRTIEAQPMPEQFRDTRAMVTCNDCRAKSAVQYHWLGLKCAVCDSYNTIQVAIVRDGMIEEQSADAAGPGGTATEGMSAEMAIPVPRSRRHSLHIGQNLAPRDYSSGLAPALLSSRIGRSMSPVRGSYFTEGDHPNAVEAESGVWDDEDVDFWGRSPADLAAEEEDEEDEDEEDDDDDDDLDLSLDESDDDDADEIDTMELFGHR